ncbi:MAG: hypothetical protein ACQUHE_01200 [Bacteroidia bacterium]
MRKVLLTVMMVSSLLAFNACKKDGTQGPAGPVGPAGPTGAAGAAGAVGPVGPAGATGAAGTKILPTTGAPAATVGVAGDYAFDATAKVLYGPKTATAWPAGVSLQGAAGPAGATGPTGPTGATGAAGANGTNGTQFLAGAGAPTAAIGATGDFYFNTTNSTFYGPKLADGTWGTNVMPLGQAYAAKTYTITRGFENVTEKTTGTPAVSQRQFGQDFVNTYTNYNIFTSYAVTANDLIRINQYPAGNGVGGWAENREMIFQADPTGAPGIFNRVPQSAADLGTAPYQVGAKFRYTRNKNNPLAEFTLTQDDITRLTVQGGTAFGYLTYANALTSSVALGQNLVLAQNKNVQVVNSTTNFATQYNAVTTFNLNTLVPNFEKYRQDGKVFVKYKYYTTNTPGTAATNNVLVIHQGTDAAGWVDVTDYANSYVPGTGGYNILTNPFSMDAAGNNFMGSGAALGTLGAVVPVGTNQSATVIAGPTATPTTFTNGLVRINWDITSGTGFGAAAVAQPVGPITLQNLSGTELNPIAVAFNAPTAQTMFIPRAFETAYYSGNLVTATNNAGAPITITGNVVNQVVRTGGQEASYFTNTKLVQVQVFVVPGDVVTTLRAKGVNVDSATELSKYVKL